MPTNFPSDWRLFMLHSLHRWTLSLSVGSLLIAGLVGCTKQTSKPAAKISEVEVSPAVETTVIDEEEFTGHLESTEVVLIRSRVTGYLDKTFFKDGDKIEKDAPLFQIDPRPYLAELTRAEANVAQARTRSERLKLDLERARGLYERNAIGKEELDKVNADAAESLAAVKVTEASRDLAKLNLEYTYIKAPLSGRIGRRWIDPGNLVKADDTILTSIGTSDSYYAYFDVDERTVLKFTRAMKIGSLKPLWDAPIPVRLALSDDEKTPLTGEINFADNHLESGTGTLRVRAKIDGNGNILVPGMFVRVVVPLGSPRKGILVPEEAIGTDQGEKFVFVVVDEEKVIKNAEGVEEKKVVPVAKKRRVEVGQAKSGWREITKGVARDERIIVRGLQRVRPNAEIKPLPAKDLPAMPTTTLSEGNGSKNGLDDKVTR